MAYQFSRGWGRASVVGGAGLFVLALLLASWLGFSNDEEFERFSPAVRILAALVVSLVGLIVGGTMIVAGRTTTNIIIALLGATTLLAGCATAKITWDKPGVTQTDRERDENACLRPAIGTDGTGQLLTPFGIDREVYTWCMEMRGYIVRSK